MHLIAALALGWLLAPQPDIATPGFKKITQMVVVENPNDFEGWQVVAAMFLGPSHVTSVEANVPFRYSAKYSTRLYAIPNSVDVPALGSGGRDLRPAFENFISTGIPVSQPSSVSVLSPVARSLTAIRIIRISEDGIQLQAVREQLFDSDRQSIGWLRLWGIPVGTVVLGIAGLFILRRRRMQRASK